MESPFAPYEPDGEDAAPVDDGRGARLSEIPLRKIVPNVITILAVAAGLTGVRLAIDGRFETAVLMVLVAAFLDGIDGRVARLLKAETKFGAQLDSLADIVNFGAAPALLVYFYALDHTISIGWSASVIYVIACALRLARFNVMSETVKDKGWRGNYFVGVPAPAGAFLVLLPVYLGVAGFEINEKFAFLGSAYVLLIAFLLISRLPVWSGKSAGFSRDMVFPAIIAVAAFAMLLANLPWETLTGCVLAYLAFLPLSARRYSSRANAERAARAKPVKPAA